ncbi:MAG: hypothetical protein VXX36_01725 [Verrucomicrobiota bacterium]|nr:hypothetical protein [Verrucomicrobiota bacterium]
MPLPYPVASDTLATLAFANESWMWVALVFGAASIFILTFTYRKSPLRGPQKFFAATLKLVGLILLALILMEPVILDELPRKNANEVAIVADNSSGLTVALDANEPSPAEQLTSALVNSETNLYPEWLARIDDTFRLQPFLFDGSLRRVDEFSELSFAENRSDLATALGRIRQRFDKRPLAAIVAFTDGNATDAEELDTTLAKWSEVAENAGVPVYPVILGDPSPEARDLSVNHVTAETTQFEDAQVTLNIEAAARGHFPDPVEVFAVNEAGKELAVKEVVFPEPVSGGPVSRALPVRLQLSAMPPGISFLKVGIRQSAEKPAEELTDRNNEKQISVNRGSGPYRILYVSGRPNWEYKFLRRSLAMDSEIELVGLIRIAKREPKFEWRGRTGESSNPLFRGFRSEIPEETRKYDEPVLVRLNVSDASELRDGFPKSAEDLFDTYKAIIIDDLEASFFTQEQQELIDQYVSRRGGTLLMLGGQESFQPGLWENTPIGRVLPVYLDKIRNGPPSLESAFDLTREGWLEPWMRLRSSKDEETNRLAYMTPFFAVNQVSAIKPGASILSTVIDSERRTLPAIITQRYGEGKSAAVTIADFWRWGMKDPEQQENLARSWRQLVRWAINEVPSRVELEKEEVNSGLLPLTKLSVRVQTKTFDPQDDATVILTVSHEDGETSTLSAEPSLTDPGLFTTEYASENPSGYRVQASVLDGEGEEIGTDEIARTINPEADEFAKLGPNQSTLERIAAETGGKMLRLDELAELPALLKTLDLPISEVRQRPLWHTPWLFLIALACFLGEWVIRRRQGIL